MELEPDAASFLAQRLENQKSVDYSDPLDPQQDVELQATAGFKAPSKMSRAFRTARSWISRNPSLRVPADETSARKRKICSNSSEEQSEPLYLLVCIDKGNGSVGLVQIDVGNIKSDKLLFSCLRAEYRAIRGRWLPLLSLRCIQAIDFLQFELWASGEVDVQKYRGQRMLPPTSEYTFDPSTTDPPIGTGRLLHLWNSPNHSDGDGQTVLSRFPKKKRERLYVDASGTMDGWGIHLVEGPNLVLIWLIIFFVILIGSCVFGVSYAVLEHDIQSAFAIASYVISFATLSIGACSICSRRMTGSACS